MSAVHLHLVDKAHKPRNGDNVKKHAGQGEPLTESTAAHEHGAKKAGANKDGAKKAAAKNAPKKDALKKESGKNGKGTKRPSAKAATAEVTTAATASKKSAKPPKAKKRETTAGDVMCSPAICVREHEGLNDAVRLMWDHDVGAVVVVSDEDKPVGMVTDRDACMAAHTQGVALYHGSLSAAMSRTLVSCNVGTPIAGVRTLMVEAQVRRLPVVDDDGKCVGVVAITDLVKEASAALPEDRKRGSSEASLVALLEAMLRSPPST